MTHGQDLGTDPAAPDHERRREALTMALYVSLSQLAVMAALPSSAEAAVVIVLTSVGLILAHRLAFRLSSRLVDQGRLSAASLELLGAQLAGGLAVTVVAVLPVALLPSPYDIRVAQLLLLTFVAVVGYASARVAGHSRGRAVVEVASVVAAATLVLWVKALASY